MDRDHWIEEIRREQVLPPGASPVLNPVARLQELLDERAAAFAESQFGSRDGIDLRLGRRGLIADEAASFLRAHDAGLLAIDDTGGVRVKGFRQKPGGGRYSLFSAKSYGGDLYVSLNLEYLIQLGAAGELVSFYGWAGSDVEVEVGEFDALAHGSDRVVLAMEAKARIDGSDSLTGLWHSFVEFGSDNVPPEPSDNHSRKYVELLRFAERGPVVLWLVAAQARWAVLATRANSHIRFEPLNRVERTHIRDMGLLSQDGAVDRELSVAPNIDHALEVARLTERDGQQRCYDFPWRDCNEFDAFADALRTRADLAGIKHATAWKWRAEISTGAPMSPSGRATGLELRFSYYAK